MIRETLMLVCPDSISTVFGILDPSIAPPFLYYSYIPIIFVALVFSTTIFLFDHASRTSRLLLWIAILFSVLLCGEILLWISTPAAIVQFVWEIMTIVHVLLVFLIPYFVYSFLFNKDISSRWVWVAFLLLLPLYLLTPTHLNVETFDLQNCQSNQGVLWTYVYSIEILAAILSVGMCAYAFIVNKTQATRHQAGILGIGLTVFLGIFLLSYIVGDITGIYDFNLLGPIGMVAFITTITYLIVQFHVLTLRILGAQALVLAVEALLFAALFVDTVTNVRWVLFATLILVGILGALLVRAVHSEIKQRERVENLAKELEKANIHQVTLIHFITHQLKGFVAKSRNIFAMLSEGDYGPVPETMKPMIDEGYASSTKGAQTIQEILNAANIKSGTVTYTKAPFDLKALIATIVASLKQGAEAKGVSLTISAPEEEVLFTGDRMQMENALKNLIDNSIKYTPSGSIAIVLTENATVLRLSITDTGIGITQEDMSRLFTEGGHGAQSQKVNVDSTGFGLYIVKNIIEAHNGKVWVESEGAGKGSRFIVELPREF